jgi:hypothetical protein
MTYNQDIEHDEAQREAVLVALDWCEKNGGGTVHVHGPKRFGPLSGGEARCIPGAPYDGDAPVVYHESCERIGDYYFCDACGGTDMPDKGAN